MTDSNEEARFRTIFAHLGGDADGVAAEVMTIAWRRLKAVPADDPLPWLYRTARNVVYAEARSRRRTPPGEIANAPAPEVRSLDPELDGALRGLRDSDREALLLVAWEDLAPTQAAAALGITPTAFRVRLFRARRRLQAVLAKTQPTPLTQLDVEGT